MNKCTAVSASWDSRNGSPTHYIKTQRSEQQSLHGILPFGGSGGSEVSWACV